MILDDLGLRFRDILAYIYRSKTECGLDAVLVSFLDPPIITAIVRHGRLGVPGEGFGEGFCCLQTV